MKSIIFIAPPAAGKGTQSKLICEKYHLAHISTGDLLRHAVASGGEMGNVVKEVMASGKLVSDQIMLDLLKERLQQDDCATGYILDGFPRTLEQAKSYQSLLEQMEKPLGHVIVIDVDYESLKERVVGRVSCPNCGSVYNELMDEAKPLQEGICDRCSGHLVKRSDDNLEAFEKRYQTYLELTAPLIAYYQDLNVLSRVNGNINQDYTFEQIEKIIGV